MQLLRTSVGGFILLLVWMPAFGRVLKRQAPDSQTDTDFTEEPQVLQPSDLMSYIHDLEPSEETLHQFSRNVLSVTRDLINVTPRGKDTYQNETSVRERLMALQNLPSAEVEALLAQQSIVVPPLIGVSCEESSKYYRTLDGSCNNEAYPCWGKADEPYQRWLPPDYSNGVDQIRARKDGSPLPSPRQVYQWVSSQLEATSNTTYDHLTSLMVTWGQVISHDVLLTPTVTVKVWNGKRFKTKVPDCCRTSHPDCIPIQMNYADGYFPTGHCMDMVRSAAYTYSPHSCKEFKLGLQREQMNQLTSYLDASFIYGSSQRQMRKLRADRGNSANLLMDIWEGNSYPPRANKTCKVTHAACDKRCFLTGEKRGNENPVLGALHTMFSREHNRLVGALRGRGWPEETLFHVVRKIIGAYVQHITYNEYLPLVLGRSLSGVMELSVPTLSYVYDTTINPTIFNVFVTAAFRYGHSMVSGRHRRMGSTVVGSPLLSGDFFSMDDFCNYNPDPVITILGGQVEQRAQKVDCIFTRQLTNHLFAQEENGMGLDLFSVNIQRGRDHGLPSYNIWREACGLSKAKDYSDLRGCMPDYVVDRLTVVYGEGNVDDVDLYVAGISEFPVNGGIIGPTFTCIVANQFKNLKFGDRFWYENADHPGGFKPEQLESIRKTTLASLICRNSDLAEIQPNVFNLPSLSNPRTSCDQIIRQTDIDLNLWP